MEEVEAFRSRFPLAAPMVRKVEEYRLNEDNVPLIFRTLVSELERNPDNLKQEGIFRRSCELEVLDRLERYFGGSDFAVFQVEDWRVLSCLLKRFLSRLREPLISELTTSEL
jgi:hypothetical protein